MKTAIWLVPLLLGGAVAGGAWYLNQGHEDTARYRINFALSQRPWQGGWAYPFPVGPDMPPCDTCSTRILAVQGQATTVVDVTTEACRLHERDADLFPNGCTAPAALPDAALLHNVNSKVAWLDVASDGGPGGCSAGTCAMVGPHVPGARIASTFGEGTEALRFTFYAFRPDGHLLISNDGADGTGRFHLDGDYVWVPPATYVLEGPARDGAVPFPSSMQPFVPFLKANLTGVPVGGIITKLLTNYPYSDIFGPLWVTLRLEAVQESVS